MKFRVPFVFLSAVILLLKLNLYAEDNAALKERLHKADTESALDSPDVKPWHLLASFQLFDVKGQPTETGTIEEWWVSPKLHKIVYTSPSYTNTEIENEQGLFKAQSARYTPELLDILQ